MNLSRLNGIPGRRREVYGNDWFCVFNVLRSNSPLNGPLSKFTSDECREFTAAGRLQIHPVPTTVSPSLATELVVASSLL